jgi:hypothetical protein
MKRLLIALAAFALLTGPSSRVSAHNSWINGYEVDPITKGICCGIDDTKPADHLVRANADGSIWFIDIPGLLIPPERIQPSPDGHWWRSVSSGGIEGVITVHCVFGPYTY